jgi:hypothetical protein
MARYEEKERMLATTSHGEPKKALARLPPGAADDSHGKPQESIVLLPGAADNYRLVDSAVAEVIRKSSHDFHK